MNSTDNDDQPSGDASSDETFDELVQRLTKRKPDPKSFEEPLDFSRSLQSTDAFTVVGRGHLFIEQELNTALSMRLLRPDVLTEGGFYLTFKAVARLCAAHCLIAPKYLPGFRNLDRLRDKIAHNASAQVEEKDVRRIEDGMGRSVLRTMVEKTKEIDPEYDEGSLVNRLRTAITVLHIYANVAKEIACEMREFDARGLRDGSLGPKGA